MDPTFNHLGCFCVEWVVGKLHVYPGTLMGILHGFICKKKLHKPPVGRVPMENFQPGLEPTAISFHPLQVQNITEGQIFFLFVILARWTLECICSNFIPMNLEWIKTSPTDIFIIHIRCAKQSECQAMRRRQKQILSRMWTKGNPTYTAGGHVNWSSHHGVQHWSVQTNKQQMTMTTTAKQNKKKYLTHP